MVVNQKLSIIIIPGNSDWYSRRSSVLILRKKYSRPYIIVEFIADILIVII
jgi:hypothetical protein